MRRYPVKYAPLVALALATGVWAAATTMVPVATFSALLPGTALPAQWAPLETTGITTHTRYTLVADGGVTVVRADSSAGASGLSRQMHISPAEHPWLRWRWKVNNVIAKADLRTKAGDDFPARLYVMFDYPLEKLPFVERNKLRLARALFDARLPAATLCYVWDGKAPVETVATSAYSDRVRLIVVESGNARVRQWVDFERNVARDFHTAFGEDAPPVSGIAIMTDTDNTGAAATSYFGDISFYKHKLAGPPPGAPVPR
ncbi:MAG: DUF3047 domain-containing protein [Betaproteobacteria bacterium]|nr:DUF3047 domain-containing protein [Betaproteobacteria bacterium]MDH5342021.1 DUF3047 domain-containing protein [Betaproteobacteria bacterium]